MRFFIVKFAVFSKSQKFVPIFKGRKFRKCFFEFAFDRAEFKQDANAHPQHFETVFEELHSLLCRDETSVG